MNSDLSLEWCYQLFEQLEPEGKTMVIRMIIILAFAVGFALKHRHSPFQKKNVPYRKLMGCFCIFETGYIMILCIFILTWPGNSVSCVGR